MLEVTGNLGGRHRSEEVVSFQELAKAFGVPSHEGDTPLYFEKHPDTKRKEYDGGERNPRGCRPTASFSINTEEGSLFVRYFRTKMPAAAGVAPSYMPKKLEVPPLHALAKSRSEEFVFLYLHPWCSDSPFSDGSNQYRMWDPNYTSRVELAKQQLIMDLTMRLMNMTEAELMTTAKGFRGRIAGSEVYVQTVDRSAVQVRADLVRLANTDPTAFQAIIDDSATSTRGIIQAAVDAGLFTIRNVAHQNGSQAWHFVDGTKDTLFANIRRGDDPLSVLQSKLTDEWVEWSARLKTRLNVADRSEELSEKLRTAVSADPVPTDAESIKVLAADRLVDLAFQMEVIYYDRTEGSVHLVSPVDGTIGEAIALLDTARPWKVQMALEISDKKSLRQQIEAAVLAQKE